MIKTIYIDSVDGIWSIISEQRKLEAIDRYRNSFLYRGLPNSDWKLVTSLKQNCKEKQKQLEPIILRNFTKYAVLDDPGIENSVWRQMIVGRHHGLPTRLLDWSRSPLVALHFSTSGEALDLLGGHDSVVWRIDMEEMRGLLPEKYRAQLKKNGTFMMPVDMLNETAQTPEQYDLDMGQSAMVTIEPPSLDTRIINQYSYFSVVPLGMDDIERFLDRHTENTVRFVLKKEIRWRVRDLLDQLNINERVVYPGLDGLSQWLARRYYVK